MSQKSSDGESSSLHPWLRFLAPAPTPYDPLVWQKLPRSERLRQACEAWVVDGYGVPLGLYVFYALKVAAFIGAWVFFCSFNAPLGDGAVDAGWMWTVDAFQKALVWSMAFEVLGMGCGSGPLSGRYKPPFAAPFHFWRPGTVKLPLFSGFPILGGTRRTGFDAVLYTVYVAWLFRILVAPVVTPSLIAPALVMLAILGLSDKTILLASRAEHYGSMLVCCLFPVDLIPGAMVVALGLWLWAGVSKLNAHFPSVVGVMACNSPWMRWKTFRKAMVKSYPEDLRPSGMSQAMAYGGTALEMGIPLLLLVGTGGDITTTGLVLMVVFHVYILSNVPMAVPLEWNLAVVYGAVFLFGHHGGISITDIESPWLMAFLGFAVVGIPLLGNWMPSRVSFLFSMRYYAGNWPFAVWLFRGDAAEKLREHLPMVSDLPEVQLADFCDEREIAAAMSKVPAFRGMHLHGRALHDLIPLAVDDESEYVTYDGEIVAGLVLGYNFGDGHLHGSRLLEAVQERCGFLPGEVRHVYVEAQPLGIGRHRWEIRDAADGVLSAGSIEVSTLLERQPYPPPRES